MTDMVHLETTICNFLRQGFIAELGKYGTPSLRVSQLTPLYRPSTFFYFGGAVR